MAALACLEGRRLKSAFSREKEIFDQHIEGLTLGHIHGVSLSMAGTDYEVPVDSKQLLDHLVILRFIYTGLAGLSKEVKQVPVATMLCLEWAVMQCILMSALACGHVRETVPPAEKQKLMQKGIAETKALKEQRVAEAFYGDLDLDTIKSFHALKKEIQKRLIQALGEKDPLARSRFLPGGETWTRDKPGKVVPSKDSIGRYLLADEKIRQILEEKLII